MYLFGNFHTTLLQNMVSGFFIVLFISTTEGRETSEANKTESISPRYLYNKFEFGTLWQIYLPVMAYDIVYSSMHRSKPSTYTTLLDVTNILPQVIVDRHPCRKSTVVITAARWRGQLYFQLAYPTNHFLTSDFRICGLFHVTYIPGFTEDVTDSLSRQYPADKPLILPWNLRSNGSFAINLTVSTLAAPRLHGCVDSRLELTGDISVGDDIICPNRRPTTAIGRDVEVTMILNYHAQKAAGDNRTDQCFTTSSFYYQILDIRNFSVQDLTYNLIRLPATLQKDYNLRVHTYNDSFMKLNNFPIAFVGEFRGALVYNFLLEMKGLLTPVVLRKNVLCNYREAELIFYDGALYLLWQQPQAILGVWSCTGLSDELTKSNGNDMVRGSIGILSIIVFVPKDESSKHRSFSLEITWQAQPMLPSIFRLRMIQLSLSTNRTIHVPPRHGTVFEVVEFVAPKGKFVHLWFSDIHYISSTDHIILHPTCFDGIHIKDPLGVHLAYYVICSNSTAENIFRQHKERGLTFGRRVTIKFIQYSWMASIAATITATIDHCVGYINLIPNNLGINIEFRGNKHPGGIITMEYSYVQAMYFSNDTFMPGDIIMRFQRSAGACVRIQLVHLDGVLLSTAEKLRGGVLEHTITSEDLTSPSHFVIDMSHVDNEIAWRNMSSAAGLKLFSLDSILTQVESLHVGVWNTDAYTAQIGVHFSFLTRAAGLIIQVEDGEHPPVCTIEHWKAVAIFQDMHISGPCAYVELHLQRSINLIIYKPYNKIHCCLLESIITHNQATRNLILFSLLQTISIQSVSPLIREIWQTSEDILNVNLNIFCQGVCKGIIVSIYNDRNSTHKTTLVYRASLIIKETYHMSFESMVESGGWWQGCQKYACYILPMSINSNLTTWNGAQKECQKKNASLLSINSLLEFSLIKLLRTRLLTYIGLQTKVSTKSMIS